MHHLGGVEKRLGRHAAPQNAKPADLLATLDHDRPQACGRSRAGGCVSAAPASDHGEVTIERVLHPVHNDSATRRLQFGLRFLNGSKILLL